MEQVLGLAEVARLMAVDAVAAEVTGALQAAGLDPILLKGPVLSSWLYDETECRPYGDTDLLLPPGATETAVAVLAGLGFERQHYEWEAWGEREHHAHTWYRSRDQALLDLHRTLPGIRGLLPTEVCAVLERHTVEWSLPPVTVRALDEPARVLLVALHLFHHLDHGEEFQGRPRADLERALARVDLDVWRQAAWLAAELRAGPDVAHALHAVEGGAEMARTLGLPRPSSRDETAAGFERLLAANGPREWLVAVRRGLFPSPAYLRWSSPTARRSRAGLAIAYLLRPLRLLAGAARLARRRR